MERLWGNKNNENSWNYCLEKSSGQQIQRKYLKLLSGNLQLTTKPEKKPRIIARKIKADNKTRKNNQNYCPKSLLRGRARSAQYII